MRNIRNNSTESHDKGQISSDDLGSFFKSYFVMRMVLRLIKISFNKVLRIVSNIKGHRIKMCSVRNACFFFYTREWHEEMCVCWKVSVSHEMFWHFTLPLLPKRLLIKVLIWPFEPRLTFQNAFTVGKLAPFAVYCLFLLSLYKHSVRFIISWWFTGNFYIEILPTLMVRIAFLFYWAGLRSRN